jgi:hypothetical protein
MSRPQGAGPESETRQTASGDRSTADDQSPPQGSANSSTKSGGAGDHGLGGGSARARTPGSVLPPPRAAVRDPNTSPSEGGDTGAGSGGASTSPAPIGSAAGTTAGASTAAPPTPPWRSSDWPADVRRAHEAIDAGRVPDAQRDLVREYFDRP